MLQNHHNALWWRDCCRFCYLAAGITTLFTLLVIDIYTHLQILAHTDELIHEHHGSAAMVTTTIDQTLTKIPLSLPSSNTETSPPLTVASNVVPEITTAIRPVIKPASRILRVPKQDAGAKANSLQQATTREVYFLDRTQLTEADGYAGAWIQTKQDFLGMRVDKINIAEDASFQAYSRKGRTRKMRMTVDWMDFSVEHMSKWWKTLKWEHSDPTAYERVTEHFQKYLQEAALYPVTSPDPFLGETIVVVPFFAYKCKKYPERGDPLSALVLAATVESFRRAGFGRVVVSIMDKETVKSDIKLAKKAFEYLRKQVETNTTTPSNATHIGHMEVGYALSATENAKSDWRDNNYPRAALVGLWKAFTASGKDLSPKEREQQVYSWLGNHHGDDPSSHWKYVYYTEPDSLLQTRPSASSGLQAELDKGTVIIPHRLQPVPHESDVPGVNPERNSFLLQQDFPHVLQVHRQEDACCDVQPTGVRLNDVKYPDGCVFWWACGFGRKRAANPTRHDLLKSYQLLRIGGGGTGIVTLAGSEHSRQCIPQKGGFCPKPSK